MPEKCKRAEVQCPQLVSLGGPWWTGGWRSRRMESLWPVVFPSLSKQERGHSPTEWYWQQGHGSIACHPSRPPMPLRHPCQKLSDVLCVTTEKKWCQRLRKPLSWLVCFQESVRVSGVSLILCSAKSLYLCIWSPGFGNQQGSIWHERHLSSAWQSSGMMRMELWNDETEHLYAWPPTNQISRQSVENKTQIFLATTLSSV